jgi:hypothetical protein
LPKLANCFLPGIFEYADSDFNAIFAWKIFYNPEIIFFWFIIRLKMKKEKIENELRLIECVCENIGPRAKVVSG